MSQMLALLLAGFAAVGIALTDSFGLLVACWVGGVVIQAGLTVTGASSPRVRRVTRGFFLAEIAGAWVLVMGGVNLVLATGASDLAGPGFVPAEPIHLAWAGSGLLLAVVIRLGLPPLTPWQPRLAAAPPSVRIFLHAAVHPATALLLWWRLDAWMLPWHRDAALWLGSVVAVVAVLAAAGERNEPRRAALLGTGRWAALLALVSHGGTDAPGIGFTACGMACLHLVAAAPRWPRSWRRVLLVAAGACLTAVVATSHSVSWSLGDLLVDASTLLSLWVLWRWYRTLVSVQETLGASRRAAWPALAGLARRSRSDGPVPVVAAAVTNRLGRMVAVIDRVILDGMADGLALFGVGAGWLVAWCDRCGLDGIERGLDTVVVFVGRACRGAVSGVPSRTVVWAMVGILTMVLSIWLIG